MQHIKYTARFFLFYCCSCLFSYLFSFFLRRGQAAAPETKGAEAKPTKGWWATAAEAAACCCCCCCCCCYRCCNCCRSRCCGCCWCKLLCCSSSCDRAQPPCARTPAWSERAAPQSHSRQRPCAVAPQLDRDSCRCLFSDVEPRHAAWFNVTYTYTIFESNIKWMAQRKMIVCKSKNKKITKDTWYNKVTAAS